MASNTTNKEVEMNKSEEPSSVQKLLASLQQAQHKNTTDMTNEPSTSKPKKNNDKQQKKRAEDKKKPKGISVGARMQQQAENARAQTRRPRQVSTSKVGGRVAGTSEYQQHQPYQQTRGPRIPTDILDEIEFRFISNMVESEINDDIRVCFHLELAHWYYIDHMVEDEKNTGCPNVGSREFTIQMCQHCRILRKYAHRADEVIAKFREYKSSVPTYGAILVDAELENVILVQSYFAKGNTWGFPKGKINQNEPPREAAIRETYEETGFDFGRHSEKEKKFQRFINDGMVRLYLVKNVPKDYNFEPQTRKEIRKIQWFKIDDLPTEKGEKIPEYLHGFKFFMAIPFMRDIQSYIHREREKLKKRKAAKTPPAATAQPSILSQIFSSATASAPKNENTASNPTTYKRMTSVDELLSAFKAPSLPDAQNTLSISRPKLPEMSPAVDGMDSLALLGLCTPLRPGASLNQFSNPSQNCPKISEETESSFKDQEPEIGFAMPTDLRQPVVTSDHPWQHNKSIEINASTKIHESHPGWLGTQLVNTVMHSPNQPVSSSRSPVAPKNVLGHLIGKPIQPQPIIPQAATPSALGSAEKPKGSKINLSDNSAFKAITSSQKHSVPKSTAPPSAEKTRSSSLSGGTQIDNRKVNRSLFNSVASPVPSVHGNDASMWEEVWFREQHAITAGTSISSLATSNQELAMINRDTPVENRNPYMNQLYQSVPLHSKHGQIPRCNQWNQRIEFDREYIAGSLSFWLDQFSLNNKVSSAGHQSNQ